MSALWRSALGALLAGVALAGPLQAAELWSSGDASVELSGSLRELLTLDERTDARDFRTLLTGNASCQVATTFPRCPAWNAVGDERVVTSLTRVRTRLDLRATRTLSAEIVYDHELLAGRLDTLEVTLGRQRVPWGVGRLWNPIDRFNAIGPLVIEGDQSPGVDAAKLRWLLSGFSYLEAIYALGEEGDDRAYALRLHGVALDVDYSVMGGVFEEAPTLGFDLASNLGDAAGRMELVWTRPTRQVRPFGTLHRRPLPDYLQIVVSIDYDFDLGSGLYALAEYLYNGNALGFGRGKAGSALGTFGERDVPLPPPGGGTIRVPTFGGADLLGHSRVASASEHLLGLQLGYDLLTDLRGNFLTLLDLDGGSASFFPSLVYSPLGWLELTLGAQLFAGPRSSEFGGSDPVGFFMAELFY